MLRGTARLVLPDTARQSVGGGGSGRGGGGAGAVVVTSSTFAVTAFGQAIAHELTRRSLPLLLLVSPSSHHKTPEPLSAPLHCAPLHRSGTCAHNFCQRCKRAEQKLITLKSFIKKVYFLLAHGTGQQSHSPLSLLLSVFYGRKRKPRTTRCQLLFTFG